MWEVLYCQAVTLLHSYPHPYCFARLTRTSMSDSHYTQRVCCGLIVLETVTTQSNTVKPSKL